MSFNNFETNKFGLFYIDTEDKKYFYRSYATIEALYHAVEHDVEFVKIKKKEVIVIKLEED
jgi:hypothetical protein